LRWRRRWSWKMATRRTKSIITGVEGRLFKYQMELKLLLLAMRDRGKRNLRKDNIFWCHLIRTQLNGWCSRNKTSIVWERMLVDDSTWIMKIRKVVATMTWMIKKKMMIMNNLIIFGLSMSFHKFCGLESTIH